MEDIIAKRLNLVGQKFGRLEVLEFDKIKHYDTWWKCKCDCGNITSVAGYRLRNGSIQSCGCLKNEKTRERQYKHGGSNTKLYKVWNSMKRRCEEESQRSYKWYGAKGIKVCEEWHDFSVFQEWALNNGYEEGLSIDRIDSEKDYMPSNCRWISMAENVKNMNLKNSKHRYCKDLKTGKIYNFYIVQDFIREHPEFELVSSGISRATNSINNRYKHFEFGYIDD